ncbi:General odorant-binding protein 72 (Fragment) [Anthophora retusa]
MKGLNVYLLVVMVFVLVAIKDTESKRLTIEEAKKMIKNLRKVCSKKNDTPKEFLDGQHKGEFPKDERLMCYMRCILTATKSMKNDEILWDFFVNNARLMLVEEYIPRVENVVEVCKVEVTATDGCEKAWQFGQCVYRTDKEVILKYNYIKNGISALHGPMNNSLTVNNQEHVRTKRNFQSSRRPHHLRHRRHSRRKAESVAAVCRNSKTKPQCRRV